MASYYANNRAKLIAQSTARNKQFPEKRREIQRKADEKHKPKKMARLYGIPEGFAKALLLVKYCRICGGQATDIDHDHASGKARSRLCHKCNKGLGHFMDSPELLRRAAEYLESYIE